VRLLSELIPAEIIPFVWFSGIAITVYVFFRKFSDVIKEKIKQGNISKRKTEASKNSTDTQIDNIIDNAPRMLSEINKQIEEQKAKGVSDEQMSGLYRNKQIFEFATNNSEVISLAKPILKKLIKFGQGLI
jgi:hypothetical protein